MTGNRIYYIEDDESIGTDVSAYLSEKGYDVKIITTIAEAKSMLNHQMPILCLLDWNLPDGTGEELCKWIRNRQPDMPVIFITVKDQVNDIVISSSVCFVLFFVTLSLIR